MSGNLPAHAEIVIVGGGVAGASLAWQLTRLGKRDIVVQPVGLDARPALVGIVAA